MRRILEFAWIFLLALILMVFSACDKTADENIKESAIKGESNKKQVILIVSAASSLKDVLNEIKDAYGNEVTDVNITYNFGSTGSLQQQIENGAGVDLFISAAQKQMDALRKKGLIEEESTKNLLENGLVLIVPRESTLSLSFEGLAQDNVKKIALGEPKSVPAGQYAREVFNILGIEDKISSKVVYGKDVREVLTWVETGNVDAGIVYVSDAKVSQKVKVVDLAPEKSHMPILYPAGIIKSSKNKEAAKAFLDFLSGEKSKVIFEKYGFKVGGISEQNKR